MSLRRLLALVFAVSALLSTVSVVAGATAFLAVLEGRRELVDELDPARLRASEYFTALVNQQSGVRGFALSGAEEYLEAYRAGLDEEGASLDVLADRLAPFPRLRDRFAQVRLLAEEWRRDFAEQAIEALRAGQPISEVALVANKESFDRVRRSYKELEGDFDEVRGRLRDELDNQTVSLVMALVGAAGVLVALSALVFFTFRRWVLAPLGHLGTEAQRVASGDLVHEVRSSGPAEFVILGADIEAMRARIVSELEMLETQAADLSRSNAELEQFAYVASHDLQEPLRKVSSFCQLLQSRYSGQLDDRADQYIEFAVDGAKRMQALINDLLAFSRVGRRTGEFSEVDCALPMEHALRNLETAREEAGARIAVFPLPVVSGDATLLTALFQNLIGNSIKYRGEAAPKIRVAVERRDDMWHFAVADNGIGIKSQYAERVFLIFQRLHPKEEYAGTGIGLALCRKVVEFHGGRIWVDPEAVSGTTVRFTLPVIQPAASIETREDETSAA